jgi:hypothetical protein
MSHYGPCSYYSLGWVCPRDRLRQPFKRRQAQTFSYFWLIPVPVPTVAKLVISGKASLLMTGATGESVSMPSGQGAALSFSASDQEEISG